MGLESLGWAKLNANSKNTSVSPYAGPTSFVYKWRSPLYFRSICSVAIGKDDIIYFIDAYEGLKSIDKFGNINWVYHNYGENSIAIADDGTIYVSTSNRLIALNPDGTVKWDVYAGYINSAPSIGLDGTIYLCGILGYTLKAFDPIDGNRKWSYYTNSHAGANPAIGSDGAIYFGEGTPGGWPSDDYFHCVNTDGSIRWKYQVIYNGNHYGTIDSASIDSNDNIYFLGIKRSSSKDALFSITSSGYFRWVYEIDHNLYVRPRAFAIDNNDVIYVCDSYGYLHAINSDGSLKWKIGGTSPYLFSLVTLDRYGRLYSQALKGRLVAIDPANGEIILEGIPSISFSSDSSIVIDSESNLYGFSDVPGYALLALGRGPIGQSNCQVANVLIDAKTESVINFI